MFNSTKISQQQIDLKFDTIKIENARAEFRNKEFKKSLESYGNVTDKAIFQNLDLRVIEYCKRHI